MIIDPTELKNRHAKRLAGMHDNKVYIGPENVTVEITNACNIRCQFCVTEHAPGNPAHFEKAHFLPLEKFREIVNDSVQMKVNEITIVGSGEPTIHPSFRDMMKCVENQPLYVKLHTNATFPLDYCSDVLKVDHVIINLSAIDREHYINMTGKDLFNRVIANIERLVSMRDTDKPGFKIEIAYIVNTVNFNQIPKMKELAVQLDVNTIDFRKMIVIEYNKEIIVPENLSPDLASIGQRTPPACLNGWFYILVMSGGNFSNCYMIPQLGFGDLNRYSLKQYWFSSHMDKIRLLGKYGHTQKKYKACLKCPSYDENIQRAQDLDALEENKV